MKPADLKPSSVYFCTDGKTRKFIERTKEGDVIYQTAGCLFKVVESAEAFAGACVNEIAPVKPGAVWGKK